MFPHTNVISQTSLFSFHFFCVKICCTESTFLNKLMLTDIQILYIDIAHENNPQKEKKRGKSSVEMTPFYTVTMVHII